MHPEMEESVCEDLGVGKRVPHLGNSEFNVSVIETHIRASHAEAQGEAVRAAVGAQGHEFLRGPGSFQLATPLECGF